MSAVEGDYGTGWLKEEVEGRGWGIDWPPAPPSPAEPSRVERDGQDEALYGCEYPHHPLVYSYSKHHQNT